jgi:hypothetical protein
MDADGNKQGWQDFEVQGAFPLIRVYSYAFTHHPFISDDFQQHEA